MRFLRLGFFRRGEGLSRGRLIAIVALIALVVGNAAFLTAHALATRRPVLAASGGTSNDIVSASAIPGGAVLAATTRNHVELFRGGRVVASQRLSGTITDTAVDPSGRFLYVGTSLGTVRVYGPSLRLIRLVTLPNPVVGLATMPSGALIVASGSGAFTDQYFLTAYSPGAAATHRTHQAVFTITAVSTLGSTGLYGTINSMVGAVPTDGSRGWTAGLTQPITALLGVPTLQELMVGDQHGGVTLVKATGGVIGRDPVSTSAVSALAYDSAHRQFIVGTSDGEIIVLSTTGRILLRRTPSTGPIEAILPGAGGQMTVIPQEGAWQTFNAAGVTGAAFADGLPPWWIGFNIADLLLLGAGLILALNRARSRAAQLLRDMRRARLAYLLIAPEVILLVVFAYYPAASSFWYSFTDFSLGSAPKFIGLANYVQIFTQDAHFRTGLVNMAIIVATGFVKNVTLPLLAAELVFWLRNRVHQYVFRTIFVLSAVVPGLVFTLMWKQVYDPETGLINEVIKLFGHPQFNFSWLGEQSTAIWAIVAVGFPWITAFAFLVFLSGLLNINPEFYDAASMDGAGRWARFWRIDVPLLVPQFRILTFFAVLGAIEGIAGIFLLTSGGPGTSTYVPALEMYIEISEGNLGYASALGVVLVGIILILIAIVLGFRRRNAVEETA